MRTNEWVSVKKSLPLPREKVLTYSGALEYPYRILETNNGKFYSDVTHWSYLPIPPIEKEKIHEKVVTENS